MSRELLILRHGKSDWSAATDDFNRPIKKRGKRAAQGIATWLTRQALFPDYVLSSPALRTLQTAQRVCKTMGLKSEVIVRDPRLYLASRTDLQQVLADCPRETHRVMLVGHNPGLEDLLRYLVGASLQIPDDGKLLPTATLAQLTLPDSWETLQSGCANLLELVRPSKLAQ